MVCAAVRFFPPYANTLPTLITENRGYGCMDASQSLAVMMSTSIGSNRIATSYKTAAMLQIRWRVRDLAVLETNPLARVAASTSVPTITVAPIATMYRGSGMGTLPPGAVVVVVVLPLLALLCSVWFCFHNHRRRGARTTKLLSRRLDPDIPLDVELPERPRRRLRLPVFRLRDESDAPPAYGIENPVMSPNLTELENLRVRMAFLQRAKDDPQVSVAEVNEEMDILQARILHLRRNEPLPEPQTAEVNDRRQPIRTIHRQVLEARIVDVTKRSWWNALESQFVRKQLPT